MNAADIVQRVRIYLNRDDLWEGGPLYLAVLERLRRDGATGATVLQGLAGFGPGQRARAAGVERADKRQPVVVEWIDRVERVARLLPLLDDMLPNALVTLEEVPIYRAMLRARGPFAADRSVGDSMRASAPTVSDGAPVSEALALLVAQSLSALPVVDDSGRLVGLLSEQGLAWRAGMRLPLRLLGLLTPTERDLLLGPLVGRSVRELMSEPRSVYLSTAIPQALVTMVEWGYAQLPVVDRAGQVAGLLSQSDVLRAAVEQAPAGEGGVRDAEPPTPVRLVMQTIAPQIRLGLPIGTALAQLLTTPGRSLLVIDATGNLRGQITDTGALLALAGAERAALLAAFQAVSADTAVASLAGLFGTDRILDELVSLDLPTIAPSSSIDTAARQLLEHDAENLPVVDETGQLLGIIARGGLIRALLQQSD